MNRPLSRPSSTDLAASQAGSTLIEVLSAIFVMAVGLLAILVLFPLGALEMAQALKDSRADLIAANASAFAQTAEDALIRTAAFAQESLLKGTVDRSEAAALEEKYEQLTVDAAEIELQIDELESALPRRQVKRHTAPVKAQLHVIGKRLRQIGRMFSLIDRTRISPPSDSF